MWGSTVGRRPGAAVRHHFGKGGGLLEITVAELAHAYDLDLGVSPWLEMTQERVHTFFDATNDHQGVTWTPVAPPRSVRRPAEVRSEARSRAATSPFRWYLQKQLMTITDHADPDAVR